MSGRADKGIIISTGTFTGRHGEKRPEMERRRLS